jgi:protein SCO1/2
MRRIAVAGAVLAVLLAGCRQQEKPVVERVASQAAGEQKVFVMRGRVVSVDAAAGSVMFDHEAVPGFMDAMTMSYPLKDRAVAAELHAGDRITARLLTRKDAAGFHDAMLDEIVVIAQARPDYKPVVNYHVPAAGDVVPDFKLLNQSGRTIHLGQFKGRVVLLTFIYTRCPLADFCPRMSRNFAEIDKELAKDPALYAKTHLLSISFDPKYDTPAVLTSYGGAYTGRYTKERFAHWDFAAPPADELAALTQYFNVGVTPGDGGSLRHSLSTVLIGRDGRVVAWYPTQDWSVDEALAAIRKAAA